MIFGAAHGERHDTVFNGSMEARFERGGVREDDLALPVFIPISCEYIVYFLNLSGFRSTIAATPPSV